MLNFIGPLISTAGAIFGGLFQTKQAKLEATSQAISSVVSFLKQANATDAEIASAVASVVSAETQSTSWLARNWRPGFMVICFVAVASFYWGYTPPYINHPMPPLIEKLFDLLQIGICGYMPLRTVDKWVEAAYKSRLFNNILIALSNGKVKI